MKKDFNDFRFSGLNYKEKSNKYFTMNRVSEDENKVVVKVDSVHLFETKYGYALILDNTHVVFSKIGKYRAIILAMKSFLQKNTSTSKNGAALMILAISQKILNGKHG